MPMNERPDDFFCNSDALGFLNDKNRQEALFFSEKILKNFLLHNRRNGEGIDRSFPGNSMSAPFLKMASILLKHRDIFMK